MTFIILIRTAYEAGHPQELCGLLTVAALLWLTGDPRKSFFNWRLGLFGATLALLFLTKINLGLFFCLATAITFSLLTAKSSLQKIAVVSFSIFAVLLPLIVFRKFLFIGWLDLCAIVAVAIIGTLLICLRNKPPKVIVGRHYLITAASFVITAAAIFAIVFLRGTTFNALLSGIFLQNLTFGEKFYQPPSIQSFAGWWAIFALFVFLLYFLFSKRTSLINPLNIALVKAAYGLIVMLMPFVLYFVNPESALIIGYATPFLWISLIEGEVKFSEKTILPRTILVFAAVLQTLQIFPLPATQVNYGTFLILITVVLCLHDAFRDLSALKPKLFAKSLTANGLTAAALLSLAGICAFYGFFTYRTYQRQLPLNLYGADRVRLSAENVAAFNFLAKNIEADCDELFSMPGLYSFNFWTRKEPPNSFNATFWMTLLSAAQQQTIMEKLKTQPRVCVLYNQPIAEGGLRNQTLDDIPLAHYILTNFTAKYRTGDYQLLLHKDTPVE